MKKLDNVNMARSLKLSIVNHISVKPRERNYVKWKEGTAEGFLQYTIYIKFSNHTTIFMKFIHML